MSFFLMGGEAMMLGLGFSVARARAAKVSIIKLIQRSWTIERAELPVIMVLMKVTARAEKFTVT